MYAVILAGGSSQRLWPLSRKQNPKQFLSYDNQKTLLEQTYARIEKSVPVDHVWITTTETYKDRISKYTKSERIVIEPCSRNTGPAILLTCLKIYQKNPAAVITYLPSDAFVSEVDTELFTRDIRIVFDFASKNNCIVLMGIKPTHSATGYGYIEYLDFQTEKEIPQKVKQFHEKPSREVAETYVNKKNMLWNSGIVCAKAEVLINEFKEQAPEMYYSVCAHFENKISYDQVCAGSVDYEVLEKSTCTYVLPAEFSWLDVGTINTFISLKNKYQTDKNNILSIESKNNVVDTDILTVLMGVDDLCVVKTDDVLLIIKKDQEQKVRTIIDQLCKQGKEKYI